MKSLLLLTLFPMAAEVAGNHYDAAGLDFVELKVERFEKLAREKTDQNKPTFTTVSGGCPIGARSEEA